MNSRKSCNNCLKITEHKFVETTEKVIQNYRPHNGKRFLTPREAKEIIEHWQCAECGHYGKFNIQLEYKERKLNKS